MDGPVAIEVTDLHKSFRIPERRSVSGAPGLTNPFASAGRDLTVLRDISFEVRRGEFFGIVGRNGSGKSTLLKMLASIYRADAGRIRMAGRLAPFLELGVGFNNELTALDNVVVNGVMMGLSSAEARARYREIVDFAGLADYTDLKLKNYSSGMKVRLGFAIMTHVDAEVLLIDEVLAVGDVEFQEKCGEAFRRMHAEGRTVVLVTHNMAAVNMYCERAMLLYDGQIEALGPPEEITNRYLQINMEALSAGEGGGADLGGRLAAALGDPAVRIDGARLAGLREGRQVRIEAGEPIELTATVELVREVEEPRLYLRIDNSLGQVVHVSGTDELGIVLEGPIAVGDPLRVRATVENRLVGGRYVLTCAVLGRNPTGNPEPAGPPSTLAFEVPGADLGGVVALPTEVAIEAEVATAPRPPAAPRARTAIPRTGRGSE
ncbi:MAG: hypothetical protein AVDCRST_MAG17-1049 [uncultured Solirubrobacterales bacterium]|uniref:ABC transporter domain-containing protein n=1 Tax=uncultured Solirubrobacterales bacterium TaxID=768556 RepID=A0A6J4SIV9_9ACTN|nr:MAG: hypothetical protein AVDCRST_MAG17-1049 [uncultured Solirubrobacterales bacterium]